MEKIIGDFKLVSYSSEGVDYTKVSYLPNEKFSMVYDKKANSLVSSNMPALLYQQFLKLKVCLS